MTFNTAKAVLIAASLAIQPLVAKASPEAEEIVKDMLQQKADMLRQAESYIVRERHVFGTTDEMGLNECPSFNGIGVHARKI